MKSFPRFLRGTVLGWLFLTCLIAGILSITNSLLAQKAMETDNQITTQGTLSREDAVSMIKALFAAYKIDSPGLNSNNLGGIETLAQPIYFEYLPGKQALHVFALCYRFRKPPRDGLIEAFHEEERRGTNTGGGSVEFLPENGGLYLGRTYTQRTEPARFIEETNKLGQAATYWAQEVFPAVATKVFGHGD